MICIFGWKNIESVGESAFSHTFLSKNWMGGDKKNRKTLLVFIVCFDKFFSYLLFIFIFSTFFLEKYLSLLIWIKELHIWARLDIRSLRVLALLIQWINWMFLIQVWRFILSVPYKLRRLIVSCNQVNAYLRITFQNDNGKCYLNGLF